MTTMNTLTNRSTLSDSQFTVIPVSCGMRFWIKILVGETVKREEKDQNGLIFASSVCRYQNGIYTRGFFIEGFQVGREGGAVICASWKHGV